MKYQKNHAETLKSRVIVTVWCERISMWEDIDEIYGEIYQDLVFQQKNWAQTRPVLIEIIMTALK